MSQELVFKRTIPAPAEDVFYAFSTEQGWRDWLCHSARFRPISGRNYQLSWDRGWFAAGSILSLERPRTLELTWRGPDDPKASRVRIELRPRGGGTEVEIHHSGLGDGPAWEQARAEAQKGWELGLDNLESIFTSGEDLRIVRRPMLGIMMNDFTKQIAEEIGVPVIQGVRVDQPVEGMGAQRAGMQHDDVIVEMDGKPVRGFADLGAVLQGRRAGDTIQVTFYRGAEKRSVPMELSRRPIPEIPLDPAVLAEQVAAQYEQVYRELEEVFRGVSEEEASFNPGPDDWSAKQALAHLVEGERQNITTIAEYLTDARTEFADEGANITEQLDAMIAVRPTVPELLEELRKRQRETLEFLRRAGKLKARKGVMWQMGRGWLEIPLTHERGHMEQMRAAIESACAAQQVAATA